MNSSSLERKILEGELTWFSPIIPEEDYEILIGGTNLLDALPLDEAEKNRISYPRRIGPWYKLRDKLVRITIEVWDAT